MITLPNGKKITFLASSGPFFLSKFKNSSCDWACYLTARFDLRDVYFVTDTITLQPQPKKFKWWKFWRHFARIPQGFVLDYGIPNMGLARWIEQFYPASPLLVTIRPYDVVEARMMVEQLSKIKDLTGIILDCTENSSFIDEAVNFSKHPIIVKVNKKIDIPRSVSAVLISDSFPWQRLYPSRRSPLHPVEGLVHGSCVRHEAEKLVGAYSYCKVPVITSGGVTSLNDIKKRYVMSARAFYFDYMVFRKPWLISSLIKECKQHKIAI